MALTKTEQNNLKAIIGSSYNKLYSQFMSDDLTEVGNYRILRQIGEGSFGKVYLAHHLPTHRKVVLKSSAKSDPNVVREVFYHRQFEFPYITKLYEIIVTETKVWMALEYCPGKELYEHLLRLHRIPVDECSRLFAQISGAMYYAHSLNCVHRDLKLENILLDKVGNAKLTDFGFTRECASKNILETICGTTVYMAPELIKRERYDGFKIDVWSLGVILYTLLNGFMPFDEEQQKNTEWKIVNEMPSFDSTLLGPDAVDLLSKLLAKDPIDRPSMKEVLEHPYLQPYGNVMLEQADNILYKQRNNLLKFHSKLEKKLLKRLRQTGVDTHSMKHSVQKKKCDSLSGTWLLLLEKEKQRRKKNMTAPKKTKSVLSLTKVFDSNTSHDILQSKTSLLSVSNFEKILDEKETEEVVSVTVTGSASASGSSTTKEDTLDTEKVDEPISKDEVSVTPSTVATTRYSTAASSDKSSPIRLHSHHQKSASASNGTTRVNTTSMTRISTPLKNSTTPLKHGTTPLRSNSSLKNEHESKANILFTKVQNFFKQKKIKKITSLDNDNHHRHPSSHLLAYHQNDDEHKSNVIISRAQSANNIPKVRPSAYTKYATSEIVLHKINQDSSSYKKRLNRSDSSDSPSKSQHSSIEVNGKENIPPNTTTPNHSESKNTTKPKLKKFKSIASSEISIQTSTGGDYDSESTTRKKYSSHDAIQSPVSLPAVRPLSSISQHSNDTYLSDYSTDGYNSSKLSDSSKFALGSKAMSTELSQGSTGAKRFPRRELSIISNTSSTSEMSSRNDSFYDIATATTPFAGNSSLKRPFGKDPMSTRFDTQRSWLPTGGATSRVRRNGSWRRRNQNRLLPHSNSRTQFAIQEEISSSDDNDSKPKEDRMFSTTPVLSRLSPHVKPDIVLSDTEMTRKLSPSLLYHFDSDNEHEHTRRFTPLGTFHGFGEESEWENFDERNEEDSKSAISPADDEASIINEEKDDNIHCALPEEKIT
ncbi:hypothetical protein TBLA_0B03860 [Henningerozyma blattae CBS 6284]|uniref:non-specific serine/threonine protein kinase n=1 Tax=Henningerozyma blattae (strain ATCC 34711 / CBS 6284 / DSM 70876 / NBRC 10599 / NRRL Y-10934 / UCD 77-7) TaxID=1071380 RepID=I2GYM3_HENB6|nr:hypothetical protein TBLA_0B03860 [Tetrapisispora blattae CBS 6284]CCH59225.1 hypothetical protein TBLA_0B03860 [Tetrapisispora blattae CBS 6284]